MSCSHAKGLRRLAKIDDQGFTLKYFDIIFMQVADEVKSYFIFRQFLLKKNTPFLCLQRLLGL